MPYVLEGLVVDRVDLVDEGANSAAFIEVFKRKETPMDFSEIIAKMKPEHATVIQQQLDTLNADLAKARGDLDAANTELAKNAEQLKEANDALATANTEIETLKAKCEKECGECCTCDGEEDENGMCKACGKPKKKSASFDEAEVLKSMPAPMREEFLKMRAQKEAAEEQVRKAAEEKRNAEAIAKAATLKALPVDQSTLVDIIKSCDQKVVDVLSTVAAAIDSTVLQEIGKSGNGKGEVDAWEEIETKAAEIAKRDSVTKQRAIAIAIKENPNLYNDYLNGGKK